MNLDWHQSGLKREHTCIIINKQRLASHTRRETDKLRFKSGNSFLCYAFETLPNQQLIRYALCSWSQFEIHRSAPPVSASFWCFPFWGPRLFLWNCVKLMALGHSTLQFFLLFVLRHSKQVSQYVRLLGHSECMDIDSGFFHALFGSLMLIY